MGLHIKKNDETGEIFVSNIGLFLKYFEGEYGPYCMDHTVWLRLSHLETEQNLTVQNSINYFLKILKVPESDAEKSNVMVNDIIACINGIELKNESIHECANLMGSSKEYVDFKLKRVVQNKEWIGLSLGSHRALRLILIS